MDVIQGMDAHQTDVQDPRSDAFALAIASGKTVKEAADQAGIGERTAYRRLKMLQVRQRINEIRAELTNQTIGLLAKLGGDAVERLGALLAAESETVRLSAARAIIDHLFKARELHTLTQQIADLRGQLEAVQRESGLFPTAARL